MPIISTPGSDVHRCSPSWVAKWSPATTGPLMPTPPGVYAYPRNQWAPDGTVWECESCGKTWVAHHPYANVLIASWRPESRRERRRRERRAP